MLPLLVLFLELNAKYLSLLLFLQKLEYIATKNSYTDLNKGGKNQILTISNSINKYMFFYFQEFFFISV